MRRPPRIVVLVGLLAAIGAWIVFDESRAPTSLLNRGEPARPVAATRKPGGAAAPAAEIPARAALEELRADPFQPQSWEPPVKIVVAPVRAPSAPPLPYRFAGRLYDGGAMQVFLGKGDALLTAKQGDTLDGQYRVESVRDDEINLVYLPMGVKYRIQFSPLLDPVEGMAASVPPANAPAGPAVSQPRSSGRVQPSANHAPLRLITTLTR